MRAFAWPSGSGLTRLGLGLGSGLGSELGLGLGIAWPSGSGFAWPSGPGLALSHALHSVLMKGKWTAAGNSDRG